jgi:hypothetical protein
MKFRWLLWVLVAWAALISGSARAGEPYLEFVEKLRDRQYFDTALDYLEWVQAQKDVPADIKAVLPYEKAQTLMQWAKAQRNPEKANASLDRAKSFLQEFLKANPDHEFSGQANTELAQVLVQKGKVLVLQSRSPSNQGKKAEFQKQARDYFAEARKVFQAALTRHEAAWKKFPVYIDKAKDPEQFEQRGKAELAYLQSQLNLALVTYEEAQSYDAGSADNKKGLTEAAKEFEEIHTKYRSQIVGLYARMYQGKCFEEQDDLQKAFGIYNELLEHNSESDSLKKLQDQVTQYRLICLNHPKRSDYQLVIQEAEAWLKANPGKVRSRVGVGIRWELARAYESLAKSESTPKEQRNGLLQRALSTAREVNRIPGEYRDVSQVLIQRVMVALNREPGDPKDFETAFSLAHDAIDKIKELKDAVDGGKNKDEMAKAKQDLQHHLTETARILNLALSLVKPDTDKKDINRARYWLSYTDYLLGRSYDAAVIGEFIARRYYKVEEAGSLPLDAAYLAMAAYVQAYNFPANKQKDVDIQRMIGICNFITTTWPQSDKAVDARMMLGRMYSQINEPAEAANWFTQIPLTSPQYLDAQLAAGQAYWAAYLKAGEVSENERPAPEKIAEFQKKAQEMLKNGIAESEKKMADTEPLSQKLALAKLSLAQMENSSGHYAEAVQLLETGKHPILQAEIVKGNESVASESYRQLLRAYIGVQNLEAAKKAMNELEKIESAAGRDVTPLYVALGKQFKEELDRLEKTNKQQHQVVLKSFETFLQNMLARPDGQNFNSLAWVGETYFALGEGTDVKEQSAAYYAQAAKAFQDILERTKNDAQFATPQQVASIKFRLVNCKRQAGEYEAALALIKDILKTRANALDVQMEAARTYEDWAAAGQTDSVKLWNTAIQGVQSDKAGSVQIWGWGTIAQRLAGQIEAGSTNKDYQEKHLEARYHVAYCRHRAALTQSKTQKKLDLLQTAEQDILYTIALQDLDDEWYNKFNGLYRDNKTAMGQIPTDLERTRPVVAQAAPAKPKAAAKKKPKTAVASAPAVKPAEPPQDSSLIWIIGFLVIAVAAVGGFVYMSLNSGKKKRVALAATAAPTASKPAAARPAATEAKPKPKAKTKP